jgi:lipoate-protein ligase A
MSGAAWLVLDSAAGEAAFNMALDEALLEAMPRLEHPLLRFYAWTQPAASFGYFQKHAVIASLTALRPLVRRPTGGGLVPHNADWTYSVMFPPNHPWYWLPAIESYRRVHEWLQQAFAIAKVTTEIAPSARKVSPGQCFAGHEQFDLLRSGQKLAGAAQRRRRDGLLIQGSIQPPPPGLPRRTWQRAMLEAARQWQGADWVEFGLDDELRRRAAELAARKYSQPDYNQRR